MMMLVMMLVCLIEVQSTASMLACGACWVCTQYRVTSAARVLLPCDLMKVMILYLANQLLFLDATNNNLFGFWREVRIPKGRGHATTFQSVLFDFG